MGLHIPSIPGVKKNELDENHILVYNFKFKKAFAYRKNTVSSNLLLEFIYSIVESNIKVFVWSLNEVSPKRSIQIIAGFSFPKMLVLMY